MESPSEKPAYFGSEMNLPDCEILAIAHIPAKMMRDEAELMRKKWFDYRLLHPTQATYLFAHCFNRAYGTFVGQAFDYKKRFMASFKGKDVMHAREKKSFWHLRQVVDEMGIRYDFFCRAAMEWCCINGWKQPPRPCHITHNADLLTYVANQWAEECKAKIQWAQNEAFTARNFVGAEHQLAYENYIIEQIMQRRHPKFALHTALYIHDALRIETAMQRLPEEAVREAINFSLTE